MISAPNKLPTVTVVTPASLEPVTRAEAKSYARIVHDYENTEIDRLIAVAREWVEEQTNRRLVNTLIEAAYDEFPPGVDPLVLPFAPLYSIAAGAVTYYDGAGASQTLSLGNYAVDSDELPRIVPLPGYEWPDTDGRAGGIVVQATYGYGTATTAVPQILRQAILMLVNHWFDNRESVITGSIATRIPLSVTDIIDRFRLERFA